MACGDPASHDVVGPFTGSVHRFIIDRIDLPRDANESAQVAADLDGDGMPENKFGNATAALATANDLSPDAADMIAAGALQSFIELQADDLSDDDSVGIRYIGGENDAAEMFGGRIADGSLLSNRTRDTTHPALAYVRIPVFVNADPVALPILGYEIGLVSDGASGYHGILRGAALEEQARKAAHRGLVQMFETEPERHLVFLRGVDTDENDILSYDEAADSILGLLVAADVQLYRGNAFSPVPGSMEPDSVSLGFGFHLTPCAVGDACATGISVNACRNRVRDGVETDVDCGGGCQPCWADKACTVNSDCQSNACSGVCQADTCDDGVRDGYESDVDCGGTCPACTAGRACAADRDCTSDRCSNTALPGVCS